MFAEELERGAFKASNREFGWARTQVPLVVSTLAGRGLAILGGELWWVLDGAHTWNGSIPQAEGVDAVYTWETIRREDEPWRSFVARCARDTLEAVAALPREGEVRPNLPGRILYNLTWVDESEYLELGSRAV
jgi:hypothetical protein